MEITMSEAINVLENEVRIAEVNTRPVEVKALGLGIEVMKRIRAARAGPYYGLLNLFPGEKKEEPALPLHIHKTGDGG
jgi:hypothetical protein